MTSVHHLSVKAPLHYVVYMYETDSEILFFLIIVPLPNVNLMELKKFFLLFIALFIRGKVVPYKEVPKLKPLFCFSKPSLLTCLFHRTPAVKEIQTTKGKWKEKKKANKLCHVLVLLSHPQVWSHSEIYWLINRQWMDSFFDWTLTLHCRNWMLMKIVMKRMQWTIQTKTNWSRSKRLIWFYFYFDAYFRGTFLAPWNFRDVKKKIAKIW